MSFLLCFFNCNTLCDDTEMEHYVYLDLVSIEGHLFNSYHLFNGSKTATDPNAEPVVKVRGSPP